jgi:hypothetical protein
MTSRRSSGSIRAASAVEPTRSENITVTWRRSPTASRGGSAIDELADDDTGEGTDVVAGDDAAVASISERKRAIASSNLRRSPTRTTPRSFKSSAVNLGSTSLAILFSRNAASY